MTTIDEATETDSPPDTAFDVWAVVEIMGHRRLAGRVTEQVVARKAFLRIDVPDGDDSFVTQLYGPDSVFCITPTDEATARLVARHAQPVPIARWELAPPGEPEF